jgi:tetratricopeptide (TPR) repeat protein
MLQEHIEDQATLGPDYAPACTLLGQAYANLGYWEQAENWCRRALRSDELALEAYYTLALVLQHQGQLDQAIRSVLYPGPGAPAPRPARPGYRRYEKGGLY